MGEYRWIQLSTQEGRDAELSLETNVNPAAKSKASRFRKTSRVCGYLWL